MLYSLFEHLYALDLPGSRLFSYLSVRTGVAFVISLLLTLALGGPMIRFLSRNQVRDQERDLGLEGAAQKQETPTMGGILFVLTTLVTVLLVADLSNPYLWIMIGTLLWLGLLGGIDDYIKVYRHDKRGLNGWVKVAMQVTLGLFVGLILYLSPQTGVRTTRDEAEEPAERSLMEHYGSGSGLALAATGADAYQLYADAGHPISVDQFVAADAYGAPTDGPRDKSLYTTIPFIKDNHFDYRWLVPIDGPVGNILAWVLFMLIVAFIVTAVSNGANLTDGLDGLSAGVSVPVIIVLGVFAYLSGNVIYASYLNIMYIPGLGELVVFMGAFLGSIVGFLWYNSYPAQIFMGDTGSLAIGGVIGVYAVLVRKELLLIILCGVFLVETASVALQTSYFKYTRRKYGQGRRIFRMAPLHHHYQLKGMPEPKIVTRFWIISALLAVLTVATLKIR